MRLLIDRRGAQFVFQCALHPQIHRQFDRSLRIARDIEVDIVIERPLGPGHTLTAALGRPDIARPRNPERIGAHPYRLEYQARQAVVEDTRPIRRLEPTGDARAAIALKGLINRLQRHIGQQRDQGPLHQRPVVGHHVGRIDIEYEVFTIGGQQRAVAVNNVRARRVRRQSGPTSQFRQTARP